MVIIRECIALSMLVSLAQTLYPITPKVKGLVTLCTNFWALQEFGQLNQILGGEWKTRIARIQISHDLSAKLVSLARPFTRSLRSRLARSMESVVESVVETEMESEMDSEMESPSSSRCSAIVVSDTEVTPQALKRK